MARVMITWLRNGTVYGGQMLDVGADVASSDPAPDFGAVPGRVEVTVLEGTVLVAEGDHADASTGLCRTAGERVRLTVTGGDVISLVEVARASTAYRLAGGVDLPSGQATTPVYIIEGGARIMAVSATNYSGATLTLQFLGPDGVKWLDCAGATFTQDGVKGVELADGVQLRLRASGGAPAGVFADLG